MQLRHFVILCQKLLIMRQNSVTKEMIAFIIEQDIVLNPRRLDLIYKMQIVSCQLERSKIF